MNKLGKTQAAIIQENAIHAANQEAVHRTLSEYSFGDMLKYVKAHIEARPDASKDLLTQFDNEVGRYAWGLE